MLVPTSSSAFSNPFRSASRIVVAEQYAMCSLLCRSSSSFTILLGTGALLLVVPAADLRWLSIITVNLTPLRSSSRASLTPSRRCIRRRGGFVLLGANTLVNLFTVHSHTLRRSNAKAHLLAVYA